MESGCETNNNIKTLAVIDLETNGLPWEQFNVCSITELSVYAFSAQCLTDKAAENHANKNAKSSCGGMDGIADLSKEIPDLPRVLHKLTLMVNPQRMIHPESERITGLCNEMLCNEASFDINTANCLLGFLERLEKPICFVAHNGWSFDYPVIRHVFEKINMTVPSTIYCVDSLKAFIEMDEKQYEMANIAKTLMESPKSDEDISKACSEEITKIATKDPLEDNAAIDWRKVNETTPHRKTKVEKRKREVETTPCKNQVKRTTGLKVRRELFSKPFQPQSKYPPKGKYQLGNIYERVFSKPCDNLHRAESDVLILTKLILHYGLDFLAYAEERKITFDQVKKLGKF
ncbi:uncharacterized protein LOC106086324 [Stomoxys calcitrans]|uniref:uncharacterized protein LOC106086324 n=1 Tax=Stomoxys calcitrans TaxID=35570 RepID=UPI0027E2BA8D|nr:uncharacterized protein LOC106086324 [Stomoxys calcitrans]